MSGATNSNANVHDRPEDAAFEAFATSSAIVLGIEIEPEWREQIVFHLKTIAQAAQFTCAYPLSDALEPAPVFGA